MTKAAASLYSLVQGTGQGWASTNNRHMGDRVHVRQQGDCRWVPRRKACISREEGLPDYSYQVWSNLHIYIPVLKIIEVPF